MSVPVPAVAGSDLDWHGPVPDGRRARWGLRTRTGNPRVAQDPARLLVAELRKMLSLGVWACWYRPG